MAQTSGEEVLPIPDFCKKVCCQKAHSTITNVVYSRNAILSFTLNASGLIRTAVVASHTGWTSLVAIRVENNGLPNFASDTVTYGSMH